MTRLFYGLNHLGLSECNFYLHVAPQAGIEAPRAYHASLDPRSAASLLILEDLAKTKDASFGDALTTSLNRAQAEGMVETMAAYHGCYWASPKLDREFTWLISEADWQQRMTDGLSYHRIFH